MINVSLEAQYDYNDILSPGIEYVHPQRLHVVPRAMMRDLDEYFMIRADKDVNYIKLKNYDVQTDKMLLFFLRRLLSYDNNPCWVIMGICEAEDYCEETDRHGLIRLWLNTSISEDLHEKNQKRRPRKKKELVADSYCSDV